MINQYLIFLFIFVQGGTNFVSKSKSDHQESLIQDIVDKQTALMERLEKRARQAEEPNSEEIEILLLEVTELESAPAVVTNPEPKCGVVDVVLGAQWGDEGKGKLVDILSNKYAICARVAGGSNAGHTIVVDVRRVLMCIILLCVILCSFFF